MERRRGVAAQRCPEAAELKINAMINLLPLDQMIVAI